MEMKQTSSITIRRVKLLIKDRDHKLIDSQSGGIFLFRCHTYCSSSKKYHHSCDMFANRLVFLSVIVLQRRLLNLSYVFKTLQQRLAAKHHKEIKKNIYPKQT